MADSINFDGFTSEILITAGAGFIGSAVIRHIIVNTQDSEVNLEKLTYAGNFESLSQVSSDQRYCFEQAGICDRNEVERVLAEHKPDAVMHLAAESYVDRSIDGPADFFETNIVGTYTLLRIIASLYAKLSPRGKWARPMILATAKKGMITQ
jgi:dTDP-glucose 4,6-dehydratase